MSLTDRYPTRGGFQSTTFPRRDPVVYPSPGGPLDSDQVARFAAEGFLVFDRLVDPATVAELRAEVERLATDPALAGSERIIREPESQEVRSIFELHRLSPLVAHLVADQQIVAPVRQLLGSAVYVHQSRANRKPGFDGREFAWHSDFETWHAEDGMPAARAVSISLALTENYTHNGSLMVIPGSHRTFVATPGETPPDHYRTSLRAQEVGVPDRASLSALVEEAGGITTITGPPGSAVLFDCNVMHGSAGNMTPYPRTNIFVVYNSVENTLVAPFAARTPRPSFVAAREVVPVG